MLAMSLFTAGALADQTAAPQPAAQSGASAIKAAQQALGVSADGVVGSQTRAAVRRFQRANGLLVDGVIGPQTLTALGVSPAAARSVPAAANEAAKSTDASSLLEAIALCESGGDPTLVSSSGRYRGKYQFDRATWRSVGGNGDPAAAPESEQDARASTLMDQRGPSAWPVCSKKVGAAS
ncbi:MAG: hypothetical protein JWO02_4370 [Solirubrobacterales bacterium]|nr:hypothetical protein [Solirubrobacterales bacterium]